MRLIVGYDGSDCAIGALDGSAQAGLEQDELEVRVVCVGDVLVPEPGGDCSPTCPEVVARSPEQREAVLCTAEACAEEGARRLRIGGRCRSVSGEADVGSPYLRLVEAAERWPADLLVVGSHGRGSAKRFLLGSVADFALCHCGCSVRIARSNRISERPVRLVLGVDGSDGAQAAIQSLARRTWPADTRVWVVTVAQMPADLPERAAPPGREWGGESRGEILAAARRIATATADGLEAAGLSSRAVAREGDPKRLLVEVAEELDADFIFMGAHGHRRLERFGIGSVARAVAARAHCSVEVIRPRTGANA